MINTVLEAFAFKYFYVWGHFNSNDLNENIYKKQTYKKVKNKKEI